MFIPGDILVTVFEDGQRQCCTLAEWLAANLGDEDTAQEMVSALMAGENISFGGGAEPAGRMWLESGETDESFPDEAGAERFYVC